MILSCKIKLQANVKQEAKLRSSIDEMNKVGQKKIFRVVYYCGILFTTLGFCRRLSTLEIFCRIYIGSDISIKSLKRKT